MNRARGSASDFTGRKADVDAAYFESLTKEMTDPTLDPLENRLYEGGVNDKLSVPRRPLRLPLMLLAGVRLVDVDEVRVLIIQQP